MLGNFRGPTCTDRLFTRRVVPSYIPRMIHVIGSLIVTHGCCCHYCLTKTLELTMNGMRVRRNHLPERSSWLYSMETLDPPQASVGFAAQRTYRYCTVCGFSLHSLGLLLLLHMTFIPLYCRVSLSSYLSPFLSIYCLFLLNS